MPSHSLSPPSPPALNLSQYQGLFQWVSSSHQVAIVLELQHQLPMNIQGLFSLLSRELSKASVLQRSVFFMAQLSHPYRTAGKTKALTIFCLIFRLCLRQINWHPVYRDEVTVLPTYTLKKLKSQYSNLCLCHSKTQDFNLCETGGRCPPPPTSPRVRQLEIQSMRTETPRQA